MSSPFIPPVKGKGLAIRTCQFCGEMFRIPEHLIALRKNAQGESNGGTYCSNACQYAARRKKKQEET
jgi:hypothetical protein